MFTTVSASAMWLAGPGGCRCGHSDLLGDYACPFEEWTPRCGRVFEALYAIDTETLMIDEANPQVVPPLVVATACDGRQGVFLAREMVGPFFEAHDGLSLIAHNAAFDLKVLQQVVGDQRDLYSSGQRWPGLGYPGTEATAVAGDRGAHRAGRVVAGRLRPGPSRARSPQGAPAMSGETMCGPASAGSSAGRSHEIPAGLSGLRRTRPAGDLASLLGAESPDQRRSAALAAGLGVRGRRLVEGAIRRFGPLTHHIQLKASILMDALRSNGIAIDATRWEEKLEQVRAVRETKPGAVAAARLSRGRAGSGKAMQSILAQFQREHPAIELKRTPSGEKFSTAEEDLAELAGEDDFFREYVEVPVGREAGGDIPRRRWVGLASTPASVTCWRRAARIAAAASICRTCPAESDESEAARTIRGCFVPGEDHVFIDSDYSQIELVVLAYALEHQFGHPPHLAGVINSGQDVHKLIAASVLGKPADEVTKEERSSVKPISFGRPGGMGPERLRQIAKAGYGIELTMEEVEDRIRAYQRLCPELEGFLEDEVEPGLVIAAALGLTPASYGECDGEVLRPRGPCFPIASGLARGHAAEGPARRGASDEPGCRPSLHLRGTRLLLEPGPAPPDCTGPGLEEQAARAGRRMSALESGTRLGGPPTGLHAYRPAPRRRDLLQQPQRHLPGAGRRRRHPGAVAGLAVWPQDRQFRPRPDRRRIPR